APGSSSGARAREPSGPTSPGTSRSRESEASPSPGRPGPRPGGILLAVQPLVSVLIPAFNGERFLRETLASVLSPDYPRIEVLVCDDGSTDGTADLLRGFGGRIRVISQANRGTAAARNRAAKDASGSVLAFIDHDDLWEPSKITRQVRRLEADPSL